jgi:hypothetical protein
VDLWGEWRLYRLNELHSLTDIQLGDVANECIEELTNKDGKVSIGMFVHVTDLPLDRDAAAKVSKAVIPPHSLFCKIFLISSILIVVLTKCKAIFRQNKKQFSIHRETDPKVEQYLPK